MRAAIASHGRRGGARRLDARRSRRGNGGGASARPGGVACGGRRGEHRARAGDERSHRVASSDARARGRRVRTQKSDRRTRPTCQLDVAANSDAHLRLGAIHFWSLKKLTTACAIQNADFSSAVEKSSATESRSRRARVYLRDEMSRPPRRERRTALAAGSVINVDRSIEQASGERRTRRSTRSSRTSRGARSRRRSSRTRRRSTPRRTSSSRSSKVQLSRRTSRRRGLAVGGHSGRRRTTSRRPLLLRPRRAPRPLEILQVPRSLRAAARASKRESPSSAPRGPGLARKKEVFVASKPLPRALATRRSDLSQRHTRAGASVRGRASSHHFVRVGRTMRESRPHGHGRI